MTSIPQPESGDLDLSQLALVLWKGKLIIAATMAIGFAAGAFVIANTYPTFQADALLQLEEKSGSAALPNSLTNVFENDPRSVTEIEILSSRMVLGQAVADQNLDWRITQQRLPLIGTMLARYDFPVLSTLIPSAYARSGDQLTLDQLTVPPRWLNQMIKLTVRQGGAFDLLLPDGSTLQGSIGTQLIKEDLGFSLRLAALNAAPGRVFLIQQIDEASAINQLRGRLSVQERGRASGILEVFITGPDLADNPRALDAVIQAYLRQNLNLSAAQADTSLGFIKEQLPIAEASLRDAEAALNAFRQEKVTVDLPLETQTLLSQINRLEEALAALDRQEDEIKERYTPAHPIYRQLLEERERQQARKQELLDQVGALPEVQRQVLNLTSAVELAQRMYTGLLTRSQEVSVLRASTIGNVRIIDQASTSSAAIAPRKSVILARFSLFGVVAGIAFLLGRNWLRRGIRDAAELEKLGLPVFATINYAKEADTRARKNGPTGIYALSHPTGLSTEAFRSLRTAMHFGMLDARTPTVGITSAHPDAGKSFVAVNLAAVAAQSGQRVCIIDADLRRGQLRHHFNVAKDQPGLAEVLAGDLAFDAALVAGPLENLWFLPTGRYPPNPSELLMRAEFSGLIDLCSQRFDLTIFDLPPVLAVTDPVIVARSVGASLFVARHDETRASEVEAAIKTFTAGGLRLSGAILNGFDPRKGGTVYGQDYSYRYSYSKRDD